jgi:hypothetical protein
MSDEKNSQIVSDIQQLQTIEKELFDELQLGISNNTISSQEKEALLSKVNVLTQIRINLYKTLNNSYDQNTANLQSAKTVLDTQNEAIYAVEQELNTMKEEQHGMVGATGPGGEQTGVDSYKRLTLNNIYYAKWYEEHGLIFRNIFFFVVAIGIVYVSKNAIGYPDFIYNILMTITVFYGLYIIGNQIIVSRSRDNLDYDKYDWNFDIEGAPA